MMRGVFLTVLAAATATLVGSAVRAQAPPPRVIEITAERFEFWPSEVTIVEGEPVVFHIRSDDTLHGFRIVGTATNALVPKRGKGMVTVTPGPLAPGRYTFECSRLCGAGHNFMRGVLIVRAQRQSTTVVTAARPASAPDLERQHRTTSVSAAPPASAAHHVDGRHP